MDKTRTGTPNQFHAYERLLLSNDKEAVLAVARKERIPESPMEIIKDPMVLEFLGLERQPAYYEKDLEKAIITKPYSPANISSIYPLRNNLSVK